MTPAVMAPVMIPAVTPAMTTTLTPAMTPAKNPAMTPAMTQAMTPTKQLFSGQPDIVTPDSLTAQSAKGKYLYEHICIMYYMDYYIPYTSLHTYRMKYHRMHLLHVPR